MNITTIDSIIDIIEFALNGTQFGYYYLPTSKRLYVDAEPSKELIALIRHLAARDDLLSKTSSISTGNTYGVWYYENLTVQINVIED